MTLVKTLQADLKFYPLKIIQTQDGLAFLTARLFTW